MALTGVLIFGVLVTVILSAETANILCLFNTPIPSHLIVHMSIAQALADRGHNLTVLTIINSKSPPHENITQIVIPPSEEQQNLFRERVSKMASEKSSMTWVMFKILIQGLKFAELQYEFIIHPDFKAIYESSDSKFDLVICGYFLNDFQLGIAAKLKVPVIVSWVGVPLEFVDDLVGINNDPTYVPSVDVEQKLSIATNDFSFRFNNYLTTMCFKGMNLILKRQLSNYYEKSFGNDPNMPSYNELRNRISLLFYNYHSLSEGPIRPTVPQSIEIGGIQIKEKPDPLAADVSEFLGNATDGAILFSLGTNVKSSFVKPHIISAIFNVLSRLPQRIIWKWDDLDNAPGQSPNIMFKSWIAQDDILTHPNLKLFITHAGKGGVAEAQYHGVPMLAMPMFADQPGNAAAVVAAGFGISMDLFTLTEQSFLAGIRQVLDNPSYQTKVREFSVLYRDRPMTPRQSVVYWTEYVLRHKGAYHLQSPWVQMDFISRYNIDIYIFGILALLAVWYLIRFVSLLVCGLFKANKSLKNVAQLHIKKST